MVKEHTDAHHQTAEDASTMSEGIQDENVARKARRRNDTGAPKGPAQQLRRKETIAHDPESGEIT